MVGIGSPRRNVRLSTGAPNPLALEYWHFERRDGLSWYQAMRLVHDDQTLERIFTRERVLAAITRPNLLPFLGLPWAQLPPPVAGPITLPPGYRQ
jgi:hypothetical protein